MASNTGAIVGPAIAGALVVTVGSGWAILGDAASFVVAGALLVTLPADEFDRAGAAARSFWRDLADGWNEVRSRTWVWASICYFACFQLVYLSSFAVLGPVVAKRSLGGAGAWAAIAAAGGVGAVLGSLAAYRLRPRRPLLFAFACAGFGTVPSLVLLALAAPAVSIAAAELLAGIGIGVADTFWETTLQQRIPAEALSRVSSYDTLGSIALRPIGLALVGPLVLVAGTRGTLLGAATIIVAATAAIVALPGIRRVRGGHEPPVLEGRRPLAVEISR